MATVEAHTAENHTELRRELARERLELVRAIESLRSSTSVRGLLDGRVPLLAAAAFGAGFVLAGGIGATARLVFRRRREGRTRAVFGPFALVERP
jgi:hypothetical protein